MARIPINASVMPFEEWAHRRADSLAFEAEEETDGWQDVEDGPGSEAHLQLSQDYEASPGSDDDEDEWPIINTPTPTKPRCTQPNAYTENLYCDWRGLILHLVGPLAMFQKNSVLDVGSYPLLCKALAFSAHNFISINLLNLYQSLLEHSGASNTAFCSALQDFYGVPIQELFHRVPNEMLQPHQSAEVDTGVEYIPPATGDCITVSGGNIHIAVDCNFSHHCQKSMGDCPNFYDPRYILSKQEVDEAGAQIEIACKVGAKKNYSPKIPNISVNEDEKSFKAADEKKEKTQGGCYDDRGLVVLWSCQLVYNPRLWSGLGLTDGEGVECFWLHIQKLIGITQSSAVKDGVEKKGAKAHADLEACEKSVLMFIQDNAPVQLKRELDAVLTLQAHADTVDAAIQAAHIVLKSSPFTVSCQNLDLSQLSHVHQQLCNQIDQLYASLNIGQTFPELAGLDSMFVQTLLLAQDLKMNVHNHWWMGAGSRNKA
ncbi:hypothetical protein ARMGADRAFT_1038762 [Armillaria gallica]|uniref:CxC2-like cysteine cluster KDZ transposase-associated domain-containing protein n=1 Tax=Armillaria gallica TaxID=47427 RepID=A0A2H3CH05_ARMGA|nr:hypothetical protein ARMGADRAFT_1038762 [Armillaria gallica]